MNLKSFVFLAAILLGVCPALFPAGFASAQSDQTIVLSSSAQVAAVLINADVLKSFTAGTGIKVDLEVTSSDAAVGRLAAGLSDLALVAQRRSRIPLQGPWFCRTALPQGRPGHYQ